MANQTKTFDQLVAAEQGSDPSFRAEWRQLAPAREFAATLLRYRVEYSLNQRELAEWLGVSQARVVELESGECNPEDDTILLAAKLLGIEFASSPG